MANRAVDNATSDDKVKQGDSSRGDNAESPSAAYLEGNSQARPPQKEAVNSADKILPALDKTPVLTISNAEQLKSEGGLNTADSADSADRATAQHLVGHIYASILSRRLGPTDTAPVLTISNAEQEKSEGDLNTADRATAEHLAGHIYTSIIPRRLDYAEELLPKFRTSALQHEAMPVTPYAAQEKSDRHTSEYKARQLEREAKEAKTAQRREDLESKYGALLEKPDLSKLQFTPANHEALENMVKAAELGKLSGDGQMIDFALINNTAIVNSELQALADKNPSLLNSKAVREVFKDTNVLGHTGWTQSTMETYAVGTAREDVGRAIFKYVQESHPKMASTTYEDYANKFDRYFGGGESLSIHKGEGLDSVIERAFSLSKSEKIGRAHV